MNRVALTWSSTSHPLPFRRVMRRTERSSLFPPGHSGSALIGPIGATLHPKFVRHRPHRRHSRFSPPVLRAPRCRGAGSATARRLGAGRSPEYRIAVRLELRLRPIGLGVRPSLFWPALKCISYLGTGPSPEGTDASGLGLGSATEGQTPSSQYTRIAYTVHQGSRARIRQEDKWSEHRGDVFNFVLDSWNQLSKT